MNIRTLQWDPELCQYAILSFSFCGKTKNHAATAAFIRFFGIEKGTLPEIRSSSEVYGHFSGGALRGIPIAGVCLTFSLLPLLKKIIILFRNSFSFFSSLVCW